MATGTVPCVVPATTTFCPNHQVNFPDGLSPSVLAPLTHFHAVANRTFALGLWSLFSPMKTESDSHCYHEELQVLPCVPKTTTFSSFAGRCDPLAASVRNTGGERDKETRQQKDAMLPAWPLLCDLLTIKDVCLADTAAGPRETLLMCVHKEGGNESMNCPCPQGSLENPPVFLGHTIRPCGATEEPQFHVCCGG